MNHINIDTTIIQNASYYKIISLNNNMSKIQYYDPDSTPIHSYIVTDSFLTKNNINIFNQKLNKLKKPRPSYIKICYRPKIGRSIIAYDKNNNILFEDSCKDISINSLETILQYLENDIFTVNLDLIWMKDNLDKITFEDTYTNRPWYHKIFGN